MFNKLLRKLAFRDQTKTYDTVLFFLTWLVCLVNVGKSKKVNRATATVGEIEHGGLCDQWCLQIIMGHNYSLQKIKLGMLKFPSCLFSLGLAHLITSDGMRLSIISWLLSSIHNSRSPEWCCLPDRAVSHMQTCTQTVHVRKARLQTQNTYTEKD